ncbi:MAG: hypothetical protein IJJ33_13195 [Victivallales bacterium]|nr:hypothetical protein [Victivallales bacterium]
MTNEQLLQEFLNPLAVCANYRPAFGTTEEGFSVADFHTLYGNDEFYSWIGLDSDLVYAAHKAAGGLTSIYRQIGVGAERLLREIIKQELDLTAEQVAWQYEYQSANNRTAYHILDAKISLSDIHNSIITERFTRWLRAAQVRTGGAEATINLQGAIFEIRQGYKSADSKRQNADIRFGAKSYQINHIPVVAILSSQVSETVIQRYKNSGMLVITGTRSNDSTISTFSFFREVVGYNLEDFFRRNSVEIQRVVHQLIQSLLRAN